MGFEPGLERIWFRVMVWIDCISGEFCRFSVGFIGLCQDIASPYGPPASHSDTTYLCHLLRNSVGFLSIFYRISVDFLSGFLLISCRFSKPDKGRCDT